MKYIHPVAFIPNELITDPVLHFTTKRVAVVLLHLSGRKGRKISITFRELASITGCSTVTAQQAVKELLESGYILKEKTYRYSASQGRIIKAANRYIWIRRHGGYTMVRKEILSYDLTPAAFCNLLYLYRCAGTSGRAFPSLQRTAGCLKRAAHKGLAMAKSTVCRALAVLRKQQAMVRHLCRTLNGSHAANSYYLTDMVIAGDHQSSSFKGGPIFDTLNYINQITGYYTLREENNWVSLIETLTAQHSIAKYLSPYYASSNGILVYAGDEHELLA